MVCWMTVQGAFTHKRSSALSFTGSLSRRQDEPPCCRFSFELRAQNAEGGRITALSEIWHSSGYFG